VGRRLLPVALLALSLAVVPAAQPAYGGHVIGQQRILVALVTWGPEPFDRADVQHIVFDQVDAFYRGMSYGKVSLTGVVTPWLHAFDVPVACNLAQVRAGGMTALTAAGHDASKYDRIVFVHPEQNCPWQGVTQAATVYLNGAVTTYLVVHELGHSFGLGHANLTDCKRHGCGALEYGDPYDTMGVGTGDFNAKAKYDLGWLTNVTRPAKNGTYVLAPIERTSTLPQALVVTTGNDQYWVEYRGRPGVTNMGQQEAGAGVIMRVSPSPDLNDFGSSGIPNLLLSNPDGRHRPELEHGETFVDAGAFKLTVLRATGDRARLRFRWTDATAPRAPRFDAAFVDGRVKVTLDGVREGGSGLARYAITFDRRAPLSIATDAADEPVQIGKPLPGTHTVKVVGVDRAGNRSPAAVRHVKVP
jgi:gametolysin peptidase M11